MTDNRFGQKTGSAPQMENYPDVLSVQQTSDIMMVSKKTLYKLIAEGKLTAVKVGRSFRIPKVRLLHYLGIEHF